MTTKKKLAIGYIVLFVLGTQALWFLPKDMFVIPAVATLFEVIFFLVFAIDTIIYGE